MPLGPFKDFDDCARKQRRRGLPKSNAAKYCGAIKRDVEGSRGSRKMLLVEAMILSAFNAANPPWWVGHYGMLSEDLTGYGFRVYDEFYSEGAHPEKYPSAWIMPIDVNDYSAKSLIRKVRDIASSYEDTIGPISVNVIDEGSDPSDFQDGWDDGDDDDGGPTPEPPRPTGGRSMSLPKTTVSAAMSPDDWYHDFMTLQDALAFKDALVASGPTGEQAARKLQWRKRRRRYVAKDLTHNELSYLKRFWSEFRGGYSGLPPESGVADSFSTLMGIVQDESLPLTEREEAADELLKRRLINFGKLKKYGIRSPAYRKYPPPQDMV